LADGTAGDVNRIYAKLGAPPTPGNYQYTSSGATASPQVLIPSAAPGTWYILVDSSSVPSGDSGFSLTVAGTQVQLATVAPDRSAAGSRATLTLTGTGFDSTTTAELVGPTGTVYAAQSVSFDTPTQVTATFTLTGVPQGVYSVEVTQDGSLSSTLSS